MRQAVVRAFFAAILVGCASASPSFVKLDASGTKDVSANRETLERDVADCKNTSSARMAFDNCMRSKGYVKS
jgi:hypothetical protein